MIILFTFTFNMTNFDEECKEEMQDVVVKSTNNPYFCFLNKNRIKPIFIDNNNNNDYVYDIESGLKSKWVFNTYSLRSEGDINEKEIQKNNDNLLSLFYFYLKCTTLLIFIDAANIILHFTFKNGTNEHDTFGFICVCISFGATIMTKIIKYSEHPEINNPTIGERLITIFSLIQWYSRLTIFAFMCEHHFNMAYLTTFIQSIAFLSIIGLLLFKCALSVFI